MDEPQAPETSADSRSALVAELTAALAQALQIPSSRVESALLALATDMARTPEERDATWTAEPVVASGEGIESECEDCHVSFVYRLSDSAIDSVRRCKACWQKVYEARTAADAKGFRIGI